MPVVVTPTQIDSPCTELWADPDTFTPSVTTDEEAAFTALIEATWVLWSLTFERFHGWQCWSEDYRVRRSNAGCSMRLEQWPVDEVIDVTRIDLCDNTVGATGSGDAIEGWCDLGDGLISLCCISNNSGPISGCICPSSQVIRVHYRTRPNVPLGADRAVKRLADEYLRAASGEACALPERITSVTRQGVTWTILDPQDFLRDGLTGIGPIDQWLSVVNRQGVMKLIDPLERPVRVASTIVGCGEGCGF